LGDGPIMKVVDLQNLYIFSFYRFSSHIKKFEVILNLPKPYFCPLLNSNPNFKNYSKSELGHKSKVVDLKFLSNFCIWKISSSLENSKVILHFSAVAFL
jgi:hypothetical protein